MPQSLNSELETGGQAEADVGALGARNERLEKDLEAALVKVEVLQAKGAMRAPPPARTLPLHALAA